MATHPLPLETMVQLMKDNRIKKVKIFDADAATMNALSGSGIEVMVAILNNILGYMIDYENVRKYVIVGNEPFLTTYSGSFFNPTLPALQNIQTVLNNADLGDTIKATVTLNADVYISPASDPVPSAGRFRSDITDLITQIVTFLDQIGAGETESSKVGSGLQFGDRIFSPLPLASSSIATNTSSNLSRTNRETGWESWRTRRGRPWVTVVAASPRDSARRL
ncbi:hypothetical protein Cni_G03055 [Canna indica]|uniref:Glucan endo-1,3-beta-D-glucosidase n=1 Tax=Canna indica TaxID=4628 RepID=A0AAQ3JQH7_9LILI|nr:hypothetical protein Cni_G03055 [Canna indica]